MHLELPQGWLSCTDVVGASFGATGTSTRAVSEFEKRGKHGRWKSLGEFGWCRATVADAEHMRTVRAQPWLICLHPPDSSESREAFHARRTKEKLERLHDSISSLFIHPAISLVSELDRAYVTLRVKQKKRRTHTAAVADVHPQVPPRATTVRCPRTVCTHFFGGSCA